MTLVGRDLTCSSCSESNRDVARFCRKCGLALDALDAFAAFLGPTTPLASLRSRLLAAVPQRKLGTTPDLHTVLMGRGSTGKSFLVDCLALEARRQDLVDSSAVARVSAHDVERAGDITAFFKAYARRVVEIVDAQTLLPRPDEDRTATHVLTRLYAAFESPALKGLDAPIVFLSGDPGQLRAHLAEDERLRKTFSIQIELPDLTPQHLLTIAQRLLVSSGASLDPAAMDRALARCTHLASQSTFINAKTLKDDVLNHWLSAAMVRAPGAKPVVVSSEDIPDPVWIHRTPTEILTELDDMVGMKSVRDWLNGLLQAEIRKQKRASERGKAYQYRGHVILEGNPGTGKTTVARMLARVFHAAGILPTERFVECSPSTLKGRFLGDTGKNTNDAVDSAIGGVLFLDEAHGLAGDPSLSRGADTYMQEIGNVLVPRLENDGTRFVAVFAGYPRKVEDALKVLDGGLPGRISNRLTIEDYTAPQIAEIFTRLAAKDDVTLAPEAVPRLAAVCNLICQRGGDDFANARTARTLYELSERAMLVRDGTTMQPADIPDDTSGAQLESRDVVYAGAMAALDEMVGLHRVKHAIRALADSAPIARQRREEGIGGKIRPRHWLFVGNPGVGKTVVAELMAKLLYGANAVLTPKLVSVVGKTLQNGPRGAAHEVETAIRRAQGGVLFIDEAYGLRSSDGIDVLLTRLENDGNRFVAIAAGYPADIADWLTLNDGLTRRFSRRIEFDDYSVEELVEILTRTAQAGNLALEEGVPGALIELFRRPELAPILPISNAAIALKVLHLMIEHHDVRRGRTPEAERSGPLNLLTVKDIPEIHELV